MVGCQRSIGRTSRQANGTAVEICDIGIPVVSLDNSTNVSDVVGEARQDEIGVIALGAKKRIVRFRHGGADDLAV